MVVASPEQDNFLSTYASLLLMNVFTSFKIEWSAFKKPSGVYGGLLTLPCQHFRNQLAYQRANDLGFLALKIFTEFEAAKSARPAPPVSADNENAPPPSMATPEVDQELVALKDDLTAKNKELENLHVQAKQLEKESYIDLGEWVDKHRDSQSQWGDDQALLMELQTMSQPGMEKAQALMQNFLNLEQGLRGLNIDLKKTLNMIPNFSLDPVKQEANLETIVDSSLLPQRE